jgi:hypothetical protein
MSCLPVVWPPRADKQCCSATHRSCSTNPPAVGHRLVGHWHHRAPRCRRHHPAGPGAGHGSAGPTAGERVPRDHRVAARMHPDGPETHPIRVCVRRRCCAGFGRTARCRPSIRWSTCATPSPLQDDDHSLDYTGRPIRLAFGRPSTALRNCRPHHAGDQPPVSETATVIPARGATGLSMAIIAAPAFSSGMRSAINARRFSRPSVIIASMAG